MLQANHVTKTYSAGKKIAFKISAFTFLKLLFMDFLVQMEPENHFHQNYQPNYKQILAKFSSMEKN